VTSWPGSDAGTPEQRTVCEAIPQARPGYSYSAPPLTTPKSRVGQSRLRPGRPSPARVYAPDVSVHLAALLLYPRPMADAVDLRLRFASATASPSRSRRRTGDARCYGAPFSFVGLLAFGVGFFVTSVWFWQVAGFSFATVFSQRFALAAGHQSA
jgi:hypothetical protein